MKFILIPLLAFAIALGCWVPGPKAQAKSDTVPIQDLKLVEERETSSTFADNTDARRWERHRYDRHRYERHRYDRHRYERHRYDRHRYDRHRYHRGWFNWGNANGPATVPSPVVIPAVATGA